MTTTLFEPAEAVAVGLCMAARLTARPGHVNARHPRPCGWCPWPPDELLRMLEGYNAWAGFDERRGTYERHEARLFQDLPAKRQAELILVAQDFPDPAPPDPVEADPPPRADEQEEGPAWFHQ